MTTDWDSLIRDSIVEDLEYLHEKMLADTKRLHLPLHERDPVGYHQKHLFGDVALAMMRLQGDPPGLKARCPVCGWIRSSSDLPGVTVALDIPAHPPRTQR